jgi:hypothetical protein
MMLKPLVGCLVAVCLFASTTNYAQVAPSSDPDMKEIQAYRLSEPVMKQVIQATRNMMEAAKNDPRYGQVMKLEAEIKAIEDKDEPTDKELERVEKLREQLEAVEDTVKNPMSNAKTLAEMETGLKSEPLFANALRSAGLAPREYAKFFFAFFQAAMTEGFMKAGMIKELPKDASAENVKWIRDNQAAIEMFTKEMKALEGKK